MIINSAETRQCSALARSARSWTSINLNEHGLLTTQVFPGVWGRWNKPDGFITDSETKKFLVWSALASKKHIIVKNPTRNLISSSIFYIPFLQNSLPIPSIWHKYVLVEAAWHSTPSSRQNIHKQSPNNGQYYVFGCVRMTFGHSLSLC